MTRAVLQVRTGTNGQGTGRCCFNKVPGVRSFVCGCWVVGRLMLMGRWRSESRQQVVEGGSRGGRWAGEVQWGAEGDALRVA